ncbi:hypothetical protein TTHERM_00313430 (macronuclear) [Tetrahymena thermophila SB210]|uniref:Uncharacterized protein n=1 Tax=Tetrahymena thermophila (strain SB210) TaxID=312017 RepID=Q22KD8_TETTS|nr:hypothetical protein TTHERM_00313430 [Tetrahymena thermophila SB210]EAR85861.2 hypothetical protein TTHERM_00313430 [Tetrahymena thermophila SB210]|eukprot:XP_001033524.2 hypothetical protein TTHERM_00313430 [Tetrahymena thermophila SB210]
MSTFKRYPQVPSLKKEIRLLKSPNQKLTAESQQQASSSIILTGNTQYESKRTVDSAKLTNKIEQSCFCNVQQNSKSNNNAVLGFNPFLTGDKNNYSNYCSCDGSPFHYQTCRKSLIVENQKNQYPTNFQCHSREASSHISQASHLNLSKYMYDSQIVNSDDEHVQAQTPNLPSLEGQFILSPSIFNGHILEKNNKEIIQNLNEPSLQNNNYRENQFKQQSFFINQDKNQISSQQNNSFSNQSSQNAKINKHVQVKSPLSYSNLIKSLAKYTKIENDLLEETMILEKQIQDSQEKISQLISNSNRDNSKEQFAKNETNFNSKNQNISKAKAQLSNIFNQNQQKKQFQNLQKGSLCNTKQEDNLSSSQNLQSAKEKLGKDSFLRCSISKQQNTSPQIEKNFQKFSQLFKTNINTRSQKNKFYDNITKLRQFQKEILKTEESFQNLNSNNQFSSQQDLSFSCNTNVLEDSQLLSFVRKTTPQKSVQIMKKTQKTFRAKKCEQKSLPQPQVPINSSFSNIASSTPKSSFIQKNIIQTHNSLERSSDLKNQTTIMRFSNEQFPLQVFQTERLQKSCSNKSVEKMEIEKFQNYFVKSHNQQINFQNQNEQYYNQNCEQLSSTLQKKNKQQINVLSQNQQQEAKSNKKLEILNLLSKINSKKQSGLAQKQNKSYTTFKKAETSTPTHNLNVKINFNSIKNFSYSQFMNESARKSSPQSFNSQNQQKIHNLPQKEGPNNQNNFTQNHQNKKCTNKNTLAENLKILLQGTEPKSMLNKSNQQQISNTNRSNNSNINNSNQNISMRNLLQHLFSKTHKTETTKK